jgi:CheY-like chemotaxis protein
MEARIVHPRCRMNTAQNAAEGTTVIVADDDENMRSLVAEALRHGGCVVREARDGLEVLELIEDPTFRADVILIDVKMPRLSGLGVLNALRREPLPFAAVLMTGLSDSSIRSAAEKLGAVTVLRKPFGREDILMAVSGAKRVHGLQYRPDEIAVPPPHRPYFRLRSDPRARRDAGE